MNKTQRKVLLIAAVVVALMVIFPPYVVKNYKQMTISAGYGFLFDLPAYIMQSGGQIPASVDIKTLLVQIIGVLIVLAVNKKED